MSFRPLHKATRLLYSLTVSGVVCSFAQEKVAPAGPSKDTASQTASPSQGNGLKQLEDDLFKPLKTFAPNSSLDGVFTPPAKPVAPTPREDKKARELRDRKKDWVFINPD